MKKPKIPSRIKELARLPPGPVIRNELECEKCGHEWIIATTRTPLKFRCPECRRVAGIRVDNSSAVVAVITCEFD